jgi:hypothetical protein
VIDGEQVRRVEGSKFLGVWSDAELKWEEGEDAAAPGGVR